MLHKLQAAQSELERELANAQIEMEEKIVAAQTKFQRTLHELMYGDQPEAEEKEPTDATGKSLQLYLKI